MRSGVPGADPDVPGAWYPLWWPPTKIAGRYLAPYLLARGDEKGFGGPPVGFVDVDIPLSAMHAAGLTGRSKRKQRRPTMSEGGVLPSHGSYLLPQFEHATVADAMHPGILSCDADAPLTEVARMMSTHHVHCIVVTGTGEGDGDDSTGVGSHL